MHVLVAGWAAVVLAELVRPLMDSWKGAVVQLSMGWAAPSAAGCVAALGGHATVMAAAAGIAVVLWVAGTAVLPWARAPRGLAAFAAFPAGYAGLSLVYLGLALTGLWFPGVLVFVLVVPGALAVTTLGRRIVPRGTEWPARDGFGLLSLVALACVAPWALAPETHPDGWEYFLAGPARWLAAHRYSVLGGTPPLHYPDIAEMLYAVPVLLGHDAVAKWLNALGMLSGACAFAAVLPREGRSAGLLLFVTAATPVFLMTTGKNEGFAAGFVLLTVACGWRGAWTAGGFFAGLALSTKYLSVLNLVWLPFLMTPGKRGVQFARWAGLAAFTTIAWWGKAWLMTGDPAYPVASGFLPSLIDGWDVRNAQVWHLCTAVDKPAGSWPVRAVLGLIQEHAAVAVMLPVLLWERGRGRIAVLGSLAVYAAWQAGFPGPQTARWAFPGIAAAVVLGGGPARRWLGGPWIVRIPVVAVWVFAAIFAFLRLAGNGMNPLPYLTGGETRAGYLGRAFTTFMPAREAVRKGYPGGALLLVGEVREYGLPFPCRVASAHASGEAPLLWRLVNASATERDLEIRFRQVGVRRALYNYVTSETIQIGHRPFRWDNRMLRLYTGFVRRHLVPIRVLDRPDNANGGFIVYGITLRPIMAPPATVLYLPGAEVYSLTPRFLMKAGRVKEGLREYEALVRLCPEVMSFRAAWGHALTFSGDWARAYRELKPVIRGGFPDPMHLVSFGFAALQVGKLADAEQALQRALVVAPSFSATVRLALGEMRYAQALEAARKGNIAEATRRVAEAEDFLAVPGESPREENEQERISRLAYVYVLEGDLARARGDNLRAAGYYRAAAALVPGTPQARIWSDRADRFAGR